MFKKPKLLEDKIGHTSSTLQLFWNKPINDGKARSIKGYIVSWHVKDKSNEIFNKSVRETFANLTGLISNSRYFVIVTAYAMEDGFVGESAIIEASTSK